MAAQQANFQQKFSTYFFFIHFRRCAELCLLLDACIRTKKTNDNMTICGITCYNRKLEIITQLAYTMVFCSLEFIISKYFLVFVQSDNFHVSFSSISLIRLTALECSKEQLQHDSHNRHSNHIFTP